MKGTGVNKQEAITVDNKNISIIATGNQPVDRVSFFPKGLSADKVPPGWFGSIHFGYNYKAQIGYLDFHDKSNAYLSCPMDTCLQNSSYDFQVGTQQTLLTFNFDQTPNTYYYQVNGKDRTTPVKLSGNLQFTFPSNWPVLQLPRFPLITTQGQFLWNGYTRKISSLPLTKKDPTTNQLTHTVKFGDDDDLIVLKVVDVAVNSYRVSVTAEENTFTADVSTSPWQETAKGIKLNLGQQLPLGPLQPLVLMNEEDDYSVEISANMVIPRPVLDLTIDGKSPDQIQLEGGYAENESKYYQLSLKQVNGNSTTYSYLNILKAADGHLWLSYFGNRKSLRCGDTAKACAGLSVNSEQDTYQFNNIKLGDFTIDGTAYIPGVLK